MNRYVKYFSESKCMNRLAYDKEMLKKYNEIWDKVSNQSKKVLDSMPVGDNKFIRTKINIYNNKINTNFNGNKIPEDNECCACLSVISVDCIVKLMENNTHNQF